jgi:hypothetical protein
MYNYYIETDDRESHQQKHVHKNFYYEFGGGTKIDGMHCIQLCRLLWGWFIKLRGQ